MGIWYGIILYWGLLLVANRGEKSYLLPFSFFNGVFLFYLCFTYVREVFQVHFLVASWFLLLGVFVGFILEKSWSSSKRIWLCYRGMVVMVLGIGISYFWIQGFLGGVALYYIGSQLLPDKVGLREQITIGIGGLVGFIVSFFVLLI